MPHNQQPQKRRPNFYFGADLRRAFERGDLPNARHRRCGDCGRKVREGEGDLKCDGWFWHHDCWREFLTL